MALFVVWHDARETLPPEVAPALDHFELRPGLILIDSELGLSPLYHRVKGSLPPGSTLLVAPLAAAPKFKLMGKGALNWIRARSRPYGNDRPRTVAVPSADARR
jgi:hypothetical protein